MWMGSLGNDSPHSLRLIDILGEIQCMEDKLLEKLRDKIADVDDFDNYVISLVLFAIASELREIRKLLSSNLGNKDVREDNS